MLLSNKYKIKGTFQKEFDKIFPGESFDDGNILMYVTECAKIVFSDAIKTYPNNSLLYINPIYIKSGKIFEAANILDNNSVNNGSVVNILNGISAAYSLIKAGEITPISRLLIENKLTGICLFYGNIHQHYEYQDFKTFNLDSINNDVRLISNILHKKFLFDSIKGLQISADDLSNGVSKFSKQLNINSNDEKIKLKKCLVLMKVFAKSINKTCSISFTNKFNITNSFFDCVFTLISERPFQEEELLDFARIVEGISFPIAKYYHDKNDLTESGN